VQFLIGIQTRRKVEKCYLHKSKEAPTARRTANHVKRSACAGENKKRSSAAFGMVAARACTWSANAIPQEYARSSIHLLRHGPLARQATQLLQNITGLGVHSLQCNTSAKTRRRSAGGRAQAMAAGAL
jgi:hypothetical protein